MIAAAPAPSASHSAPKPVTPFVPGPPVVQYEKILRIQGYSDFSRVRPAIVAAAQEAAHLAPLLCAPRVAYRHVAIRSLCDDTLDLAGDVRLHCAAFGRALAGCREVVPFVLSLGPGIDTRVVELADAGDLLDALLLETAAWLCIEDATRQFRSHVRDAAAGRGERITSRLGPGYSYRIGESTCIWRLEEQVQLFALLAGADLPVTLMESCAMQPKMSRSGMIGIAPASPQAPSPGPQVTELPSRAPRGRAHGGRDRNHSGLAESASSTQGVIE
jgi:hypothetical protein